MCQWTRISIVWLRITSTFGAGPWRRKRLKIWIRFFVLPQSELVPQRSSNPENRSASITGFEFRPALRTMAPAFHESPGALPGFGRMDCYERPRQCMTGFITGAGIYRQEVRPFAWMEWSGKTPSEPGNGRIVIDCSEECFAKRAYLRLSERWHTSLCD